MRRAPRSNPCSSTGTYTSRTGRGSRHFAKPSYGLHLTEPGSDLWRERLAFRDALRFDRALADEYAALKLRLAQEHADDPAAYVAGKRAFVGSVLEDAGLTFGRR